MFEIKGCVTVLLFFYIFIVFFFENTGISTVIKFSDLNKHHNTSILNINVVI